MEEPQKQKRKGTERIPVMLYAQTRTVAGREILKGAFLYSKAYANWDLYTTVRSIRDFKLLGWKKKGYQGIIYAAFQESFIRHIPDIGIDKVIVTNHSADEAQIPRVASDEAAIGKLAADYFIKRGFTSFAHIDPSRHKCTRSDFFKQEIASKGFTSKKLPADAGKRIKLLQALPKPIALFVDNDTSAFHFKQALDQASISVPHEVSILSVNNDTYFCECLQPELSSIDPNYQKIGFEAARKLDLWLQGEAPSQSTLISPIGIVERGSSELMAIKDKAFTDAIQFIKENACHGCSVNDVITHIPSLNRRKLNYKFAEYIQMSPLSYIIQERLKRACFFLQNTDLSLERIAQEIGYHYAQDFIAIFKKRYGETPGEYRKQTNPDFSEK